LIDAADAYRRHLTAAARCGDRGGDSTAARISLAEMIRRGKITHFVHRRELEEDLYNLIAHDFSSASPLSRPHSQRRRRCCSST
jgi:hypothetical protein